MSQWIRVRTLFAALLLSVCSSVRAADVDAGPYVPTPQYIVERMLQMAAVSAKDFVVDLGSGDGRIVITAAKRFGARGMGVDISEELVGLAITNAHKERVADKVSFVRQDAFMTDIRAASVLTLYLLPKFVLDLRPKILTELKPGSRVVSHDYAVKLDSPEKEAINGSTWTELYYYIVPAHVAGTWQFSLPEGASARSAEVSLDQRYQRVSGRVGGARGAELKNASLRGDQIELGVPIGGSVYQFAGKVDGDRISGAVEVRGKGRLAFSALRTVPGKALGWP
jgi:16S rRNA G966 N2-methylase RsmD